jgi:hypothetical protein
MKLDRDDRLILESIVEEMQAVGRARSFGRVIPTDVKNNNSVFDPIEYKSKRVEDQSKSEEDTYDPKLGLVGSIRADTEKLLKHVVRYYGINTDPYEEHAPKDGSVVYRGHKHPDPFSKGDDAKALKDKVYFTNNPDYAFRIYSIMFKPQSPQIGQSGYNTFQTRLQDPEDARWPASSSGNFRVGFFTIATPKDPDAIMWYKNFGYEDKSNPIGRDKLSEKYDAECVEPRSSFRNIKTYLIYTDHFRRRMVSFDSIKKHSPKLYDLIITSRVVGKDDERVI